MPETTVQQIGTHFSMTDETWREPCLRDMVVYNACKQLSLCFLNMGLKAFGRPTVKFFNPENTGRFEIRGEVLQYGVGVVTVPPTEWDVFPLFD